MKMNLVVYMFVAAVVSCSQSGESKSLKDMFKTTTDDGEEQQQAEEGNSVEAASSSEGGQRRHKSHKHLKHARTEAIKQDILAKLGLDHEPRAGNTTLSVAEKRNMLKLYQKSVEETRGKTHSLFEKEEYFAKTFHSFSDTGEKPHGDSEAEAKWREDPTSVYFNVDVHQPTDPNLELEVHSAKLKLYKYHVSPKVIDMDKVITDGGIRVNVYQIIKVLTSGGERLNDTSALRKRKLLDSRIVSVNQMNHWEEFNIRGAVQDWVADPASNLGLEVSCDYFNLTEVISIVSFRDDEGGYLADFLPALSVMTHERPIVLRQKRSDEEPICTQSAHGRRRCCRYPLWVSFAEIGWDQWVVAPDGYQAYYCDGTCPHRYKTAHSFAGIKSLINLYNPAAAPAPCCTATKLSPINLLHFNDHGEVVVSVYEDMVVDECRCS